LVVRFFAARFAGSMAAAGGVVASFAAVGVGDWLLVFFGTVVIEIEQIRSLVRESFASGFS
jgi:hypothetical protein